MAVRKRGGRWVVRWREGGRGSPAHQKTFTRERDARRFETAVRRAKDLGQLSSEVVGSEQTVAAFLEEWWEKYARALLKPSTLASYAYVLDRWIVPYLGRLRLRDVSRETVDQYRAQLRAAGAGTPTVNRAFAILQGVLQRAVEWRRLPSNPVAGTVRLAHVRAGTIDAREPERVEAIRAAILDSTLLPTGVRFRRSDATLVSVLAYEGLRPGEAFALQWSDVLERGLPRGRLRIARALSERNVTSPKSARAREPELFGPVAAELAELYLALGRPDPRTLIFADTKGGHLRRQNWRQRVWIPALERAGEEYFRPYDLRHTCATLLIYEGRPITEVAAHMGHADPGFTARVYGHVFRDAAKHRRVPIEEAIALARQHLAHASGEG
jgi:integrase